MADPRVSSYQTLPYDLQAGNLALFYDFDQLTNMCSTSKENYALCQDDDFMRSWMQIHTPGLIKFAEEYKTVYPNLSIFQCLPKAKQHHITYAEIVDVNALQYMPVERASLLAGREFNYELYSKLNTDFTRFRNAKSFIQGLLEGSVFFSNRTEEERLNLALEVFKQGVTQPYCTYHNLESIIKYLVNKEDLNNTSEDDIFNKIYPLFNSTTDKGTIRREIFRRLNNILHPPDPLNHPENEAPAFYLFLDNHSLDEIAIYLQGFHNLTQFLNVPGGPPHQVGEAITNYFNDLLVNYVRKEEILDAYLVLKDKLWLNAAEDGEHLKLTWFANFLNK